MTIALIIAAVSMVPQRDVIQLNLYNADKCYQIARLTCKFEYKEIFPCSISTGNPKEIFFPPYMFLFAVYHKLSVVEIACANHRHCRSNLQELCNNIGLILNYICCILHCGATTNEVFLLSFIVCRHDSAQSGPVHAHFFSVSQFSIRHSKLHFLAMLGWCV